MTNPPAPAFKIGAESQKLPAPAPRVPRARIVSIRSTLEHARRTHAWGKLAVRQSAASSQGLVGFRGARTSVCLAVPGGIDPHLNSFRKRDT